jgi:hypothetical protein
MERKEHSLYLGNSEYELRAMMNDADRDNRDFSRWAMTEYGEGIMMPVLPISSNNRITKTEMDLLESITRRLYRELGKKYNVCIRIIESDKK